MIEPNEMFPKNEVKTAFEELFDKFAEVVAQRVMKQVEERIAAQMQMLSQEHIKEIVDTKIEASIDFFKENELEDSVANACRGAYWFNEAIKDAVDDYDFNDKIKDEVRNLEFEVTVR